MAGTTKNFKDVQISFYEGGLPGVRKLAQDFGISRNVLEQAAGGLAAKGQDTTEFELLITELHGEKGTGGGRGRTAVQLGDVRNYKGQQVKDGGVFGRIPLDPLGMEKGDICRAVFGKDEEGPYVMIRPGAHRTDTGEETEVEDDED